MILQDEIIIEIGTDGNTTITVKGVKGESCKGVTEAIEKALGETVSDVPTKEMYEKPKHVHNSNKY